ncbi:hypothetical protein COCC4DRAFT_37011 [Bipolaris maydis ATCC 48331]|uniref:NmrA-like domain-containing protein n=2 Tax=Cochliobolus heterostrophus TaxID=5016 RepID=M2U9A8_COCH5|nr:uncharacterized protein COCC4DRAFT_37011 [Bipolaris maydis ATCC 48331]EMD90316.1 hypothetical protein COCHEDRAFT_1215317 [Bipolaris maydis C5]KAH7555289.1 hypothetical protein BM1_06912 [Bipolaris maydis]ENI09471.1 hypothetical protein COCC4DRAFT_37011 [Bipolaris maydis ATCC 48331]KAJ5023844.1 hypothetical protein J3E73DRAFT_373035 [Bipolaris maydis]KAJ5058208.1 hypothetical protein J3E74DRAFT_408458 [Bipolaris maydis]
MPTAIAIAGISSTLALLIARSLLQRPDVHIRGSSRNMNKIPDDLKSDSCVSLVQSDLYDTDTLRTLGIPCYIASEYTIGYRRLDPTDLGLKSFTNDIVAYLKTKPAVKGVHIMIGYFIEAFLDYFDVWHPEANELRYWGTGNEKWDFTSYQTGVKYVAAMALDPDASGFFKCSIPSLTL